MNVSKDRAARSRSNQELKLPDIGFSRTLRSSKSYIILKRGFTDRSFNSLPNPVFRSEIAPLWIPPCSAEFSNPDNTKGALGTIGAEIRRRPRQRYIQQKLPVINTKTCTLHDKPAEGLVSLSGGKPDWKTPLHVSGNPRTLSPVALAPPGPLAPALIRIPTGRSEEQARRIQNQINGLKYHTARDAAGRDNGAHALDANADPSGKPPKKTAHPKRYIMTWLEAGGDDPHFAERFKLQSAKYRSRKEIEKLEKAAAAQRAKLEHCE